MNGYTITKITQSTKSHMLSNECCEPIIIQTEDKYKNIVRTATSLQ